MSENAKDSVKAENVKAKVTVSNEQIFEKLTELITTVEFMQLDIDELKARTGFKDSPISAPSRQNMNTDPGPWGKTQPQKK